MKVKYIFDPDTEEIFIHKNYICTISYGYGKIVFFHLNGKYFDIVDDWGYTPHKIGKRIRPRWKKFVLDWIDRGYVDKIEECKK